MDPSFKLMKCPSRDPDRDPAPGWSIISAPLHYGMNQFINTFPPAWVTGGPANRTSATGRG